MAEARQNLSKKLRKVGRSWQLYVFLVVPVLWLIIFRYVPMVGAQIAFRQFTLRGGIWNSKWVGLAHFRKFINSYMFERVMRNTLLVSFYSIVAGFPIPVILALSMNSLRNLRYKKLVQVVTYIPHFISTVVLVGMLMQLLNPISGLFGILTRLLTGQRAPDLFGQASMFPHLYVWSDIWQNMGWSTIIYIAALASVSIEHHEAAEIDGASRFQRILHVDLPAIVPTIVIMLILRAGSIMTVGFEKVYLMQNMVNLSYSEVISTYVYRVGIATGGSDFSYAAAIGMFNSVINILLLSAVNLISRRLSETSLW